MINSLADTFVGSALTAPLALPMVASSVFGALAYAWAGIPPGQFVLAYLSECATALSGIGPALWTAGFFVACLLGGARSGLPFVQPHDALESGGVARYSRTASIWIGGDHAPYRVLHGLTRACMSLIPVHGTHGKTPGDLAGSTPRLE